MKRRLSKRALAGGGAALLFAAIVGIALVPNLRADPPGASPTTLNRIARKNDNAAAEMAAKMRAESRAAAQATDSLRAAQERGRAGADAALARYDEDEAARAAAEPTADQ